MCNFDEEKKNWKIHFHYVYCKLFVSFYLSNFKSKFVSNKFVRFIYSWIVRGRGRRSKHFNFFSENCCCFSLDYRSLCLQATITTSSISFDFAKDFTDSIWFSSFIWISFTSFWIEWLVANFDVFHSFSFYLHKANNVPSIKWCNGRRVKQEREKNISKLMPKQISSESKIGNMIEN